MPELEYHDGHYHEVRQSDKRDSPFKFWDKVLYGIGSAYYKLFGH